MSLTDLQYLAQVHSAEHIHHHGAAFAQQLRVTTLPSTGTYVVEVSGCVVVAASWGSLGWPLVWFFASCD